MKDSRSIILICHNLRSCHNVGSILRTADGLGVTEVYLTGYTPYPIAKADSRLPHIAQKMHKQIQKTALGAELSVKWHHNPDIYTVIHSLKNKGFIMAALEQAKYSVKLPAWSAPKKIALVVGRETEGIEKDVQVACDITVEIPMEGIKESYNVTQAAAMALYHARFSD